MSDIVRRLKQLEGKIKVHDFPLEKPAQEWTDDQLDRYVRLHNPGLDVESFTNAELDFVIANGKLPETRRRIK